MRVHLVDPAAYTPPYDRGLATALARAGADVELWTSAFRYGDVPAAPGVRVVEHFYRAGGGRFARVAAHLPDMLRYRRAARAADVVHFQWLSIQALDARLLRAVHPRLLTAHDVLPREPRPGQLAGQRALYERMDAIVVHSEHGAARLRDELRLDPARVHVIPHGVLDGLDVPGAAPFPKPDKPVVLCFGLIRPYKGVDVLLEAWRQAAPDAELWVIGMPRMDTAFIHGPGVRTALRFVSSAELAGAFRAADLVVLPYREIDQSGVLFTALAFGKPILATSVGGFPEVGAAALVPPGDAGALAEGLLRALQPAELARLAAASRAAAAGVYSWDAIARRTLDLYAALQA
jgi:glycosyltransferase involved in cell wall biosynthesis